MQPIPSRCQFRFGACLCLFAAALISMAAADGTVGPQRKPFVPSTKYATTRVVGWTVLVNRELLTAESALGSNALQLLTLKLREITNALPARSTAALRNVPIWLGMNDGHAPCAEYHPSKQWLADNGYNPDKARAVEIGNARRFVDWSRTQPSMILHELAHAYHDQALGHAQSRIKALFRRAVEGRNYDKVMHVDGKARRSYALTSEQEYFAEGTEAFFGTNDFFPFTRDDLKRHDPELFSLLAELWE